MIQEKKSFRLDEHGLNDKGSLKVYVTQDFWN